MPAPTSKAAHRDCVTPASSSYKPRVFIPSHNLRNQNPQNRSWRWQHGRRTGLHVLARPTSPAHAPIPYGQDKDSKRTIPCLSHFNNPEKTPVSDVRFEIPGPRTLDPATEHRPRLVRRRAPDASMPTVQSSPVQFMVVCIHSRVLYWHLPLEDVESQINGHRHAWSYPAA